MSTDTLDRELRAANPIASSVLAALDLDECEAALGRALMGEPVAIEAGSAGDGRRAVGTGRHGAAGRRDRPLSRRPRRVLLGLAAVAAAAAAIVVLLVGGGHGPESPARAYGAELVRYAESTPLLLLDEPGWRVKDLEQEHGGDGSLRIVTDTGPADQRWVKLFWLPTDQAGLNLRAILHPRIDRVPGRRFKTELPNLGAVVHIDTRAESAPQYGHPGDHEMTALWEEGGRLLYFDSRAPSLAAFRERLEGLRRVDARTWLDAMPPGVVKAAEYAPTVKKMLKGIPLPPGFDPSQVPHRGLSQDRYQVGAIVGGAVACAWFRNWGEARADGDAAAAAEAERVLLGSEKQWPIFREMAKEGAYPATVIEYARKMHSGSWYGKPLLGAVFGHDGLCGPQPTAG
jgi:hypothetical protein